MSDTVKCELGRELCLGRVVRASCWAVIVQGCILVLWTAGQSPTSGPSGWLSSLHWWQLPLLVLVVAAQALVSCGDYMVSHKLRMTRLKIIMGMFSFRNLNVLTLYVFVGTALAQIYLKSRGKSSLWFPCHCDPSKECVDEGQFFLFLGGPFLGIYFFLRDYLFVTRLFRFPIIQQCKLSHLKSKLSRSVKNSIRFTSRPVCVYVVIYFILGSTVRDTFCGLFSIAHPIDPMNSFFGILRPSILLYFWLVSTLFTISIKLTELLFCIWLTEKYDFPLEYDGSLTLKDALTDNSSPIVRHLACLDLFLLSNTCRERRDMVFKLSQPGGHPHTWNAIKAQCFALIDNFTLELEQSMRPLQDKPGILLLPRPIRIYHGEAKTPSKSPVAPFKNRQRDPVQKILKDIWDWGILKWYEIKRHPILAFFVGELPDARINHLLLGGQQITWVAHSLSLLACHSLTEDNYGVMQNDLTQVITSLLHLKTALDSVTKQGGYLKKSIKQNVLPIRMRNAVRSSVKRSIYRLAIHFKMYIADLHLPKEVEQQMLSFISFKAI